MNRRRFFLPLFSLLTACTHRSEKLIAKLEDGQLSALKQKQQVCWTGTLNNNIPVFLHYSLQDKVIVGEITYLNPKEKKSVKIIGTIEEDTSFTLLEFEPDGNNTGIITGKPQDESFQGSWFSPATQHELNLRLVKKDTVVQVPELQPEAEQISGNYYYQFSEEGYQGSLKINKLPDNQVAFSIFSVTEAPTRHIAQVPIDTILMTGNSFRYSLPGNDSCAFTVTIYKGFATVDYTLGYCSNEFGRNATVDGVFIKIK